MKNGTGGAQGMKLRTSRRAALVTSLVSIACLLGGAAHASGRPTKILVVDAAAPPGIVQLDTSPGMQAQRNAEGITPQQAAVNDVLAVQAALSNTLVKKIDAMGLQAERVPSGTTPAPGELAVTMQIDSIQEGNRARRTAIGFGAGKVQVQGSAMLLRGTSTGTEVLKTYASSANSGRMPGLGVGVAAAGVKSATTALSGAAHGMGEVENSPVAEEATKVASRLAAGLGQYFAAQGWIPATAVPGA